jgi:hypothetical protein
MMTLADPVLQILETAVKGRGVFATRCIPGGTRIVQLEGRCYRTQDIPPESFAMQIDDDLWLCSDGQALDDCINHGCEPNTGFAQHDAVLYALRDIASGEELTWDYSTSIAELGWSLDCLCGSKNCRGVILPFGELSLREQERLLPISLRYLQRRCTQAGHTNPKR